jgi:hypothetical protein
MRFGARGAPLELSRQGVPMDLSTFIEAIEICRASMPLVYPFRTA